MKLMIFAVLIALSIFNLGWLCATLHISEQKHKEYLSYLDRECERTRKDLDHKLNETLNKSNEEDDENEH